MPNDSSADSPNAALDDGARAHAEPPPPPEPGPLGDPRRHDLDALRAFAMLLGIALHAAISFAPAAPWVAQDRHTHPLFGLGIGAVHGFRMPLFFMLSGFFTAMLMRKRGPGGLLAHRAKRIALPLAVGMVTVVPATWAAIIFAGAIAGGRTPADPGRDLWTAARHNDLPAVRAFLDPETDPHTGPDTLHPAFGVPPLGFAATGDHAEVARALIDAGADPNRRYADNNTALHTAVFFGSADAAGVLLDAGADPDAVNNDGATPRGILGLDRRTTEFIAGLIGEPVEFDEVAAGRERIAGLLAERDAARPEPGEPLDAAGSAEETNAADQAAPDLGPERPTALERTAGVVYGLLTDFPLFHHLWFLWFLCLLVPAYTAAALAARRLARAAPVRLPAALVDPPLALLWLVPLTLLTQRHMHEGGTAPNFGPDTTAALIPAPHVLAHYAIFFGYGGLLYALRGPAARLGRWWPALLLAALLVMPVAISFGYQLGWTRGLQLGDAARRLITMTTDVLYCWLAIFALAGMFESLLRRRSQPVRYLSDASYWLYLAHLPVLIAGQALVADIDLPHVIKFAGLALGTTAGLLVVYELGVRHTPIGTMLNGPRPRRAAPAQGRRPEPVPEPARP